MRPLRASLAWNLLATLAASQVVNDAVPQLPDLAAHGSAAAARACRWTTSSSRICTAPSSSRVSDAGTERWGRLRGGGKIQEEWWMREWNSEPDLDPFGDSDGDDGRESSSDTDTEVRSWPHHASPFCRADHLRRVTFRAD